MPSYSMSADDEDRTGPLSRPLSSWIPRKSSGRAIPGKGAGAPPRQVLNTSLICDIVAEKLLQHRHCRECGKAITPDQKYCSKECEKKHTTLVQKKKRQLLILYFGSFIVFIILILLWLWGA